MLPENDNATPANSNDNSETPMSILERRLAEIRSQQDPAAATPPASLPTTDITERPGTEVHPPAGEPSGAGTAETPPDVTPSTAETQVPPHDPSVSNPQARAEDHYGPDNPGVASAHQVAPTPESGPDSIVAAETEVPAASTSNSGVEPAQTSPSGVAAEADALTAAPDQTGGDNSEVAAKSEEFATADTPDTELPVEELHDALEIDDFPEGIAHLTTSTPTPATPENSASETEAGAEEEEFVSETPTVDFPSLDLPAQATHLLTLLQRPDARQNRKQITDLYRQYETGINADRATARQRFTEGGSEGEDFTYAGPEGHAEVSKLMQEFRESRVRDAKAEDDQRARNLLHKQHLLSQLRGLVESAETKDSSARIKALQNDWKATGPVPQKDTQELWNSYHALLDIFYNNRGLFFEMKELDRRRNLEAKEALITRAEGLAQQSSINKALNDLRQLHEEWKHIGPVPNEQREALWQRFLQASEQVHNRKKEFLDVRSTQENANLTRKTALLEQLLPFGDFHTERVNEWRAKTDELQKLKEEWDAAGLVPRDKADTMNKQFWGAYKGFFQHKNQFFKALDEEKNTNLKRKLELIDQAEAALANPDWEQGREVVIRLQKDWKTIGRVPEKQSDKVWNRFRTACDAFFDRKNQEVKQRQEKVQQASQAQTGYLDQLAASVAGLSVDEPGSLEGFRQHVQEWRDFGSAESNPRGNNERADERFQSLMGKYLDTVPNLSYEDRSELLFNLQVERLKSSPDSQQQLYKKEQALRREINELENDISTLQTNLEFFARSKNAAQLRQEYQGRIDEANNRIAALKKQLRVIRS
ncbi:DUF349 domain-containing protein [Hymenobacter tibetensis]|uniref:DUF349 domain-containing protein n=1 Tax=Hymenobacter tibetensis TaxID=497967 RepID=A0ABY4CTH6_9BACT|nr:DUF349 domain-containing protein [Hymenobacter tibetensis]UOG72744.1 DUF349 domain-containing protein [Hymenobacter tibetensis]